MTSRWQPYAIPLGRGGLDTKSDPVAVALGRLVTAKNCDLSTPGVVKKRVGFSALTMSILGGNTLGSGVYTLNRVMARRQELVAFGDQGAYSKYGQSGAGWVAQAGPMLPILLDYERPTAYAGDARTADQASSSQGLSVYAWEDAGGTVRYTSVDRGGKRGGAVTTISNAIRPKVVAFGSSGEVWLFWIDSSTWEVKVRKFTPGSSSTSDFTLISGVSNAADTAVYDVAPTASNTAVFAFRSTTATTVKVRILQTTGSLSGTTFDWNHGGADAVAVGIAVDPGNANIGIAVTSTASVLAIIRDSGLSAVTSGTINAAGSSSDYNVTVGFDASNTLHVFYELASPSTFQYAVLDGKLTTGGTVTSFATRWRQTALASKLFRRGNDLGIVLCHDSALQSTYVIAWRSNDTATWSFVGKALPETAGGVTVRKGHLPQVESRGSDEYFFCGLKRSILSTFSDISTSNSATARRQVIGISMRFEASESYSHAVLGDSLYIAGSQLWAYDGASVRDTGFLIYPENTSATYSNAGGSLVAGKTYYYRIYYESYNAQGERELGTIAAAFSATVTGGNNTVTLVIYNLPYPSYDKTVNFAVYRTTADPTALSSFYRVSGTDPSVTGDNGYVANDATGSNTTSFVDKLSDTLLVTKELDYQNGSPKPLDNVAPPPCRIVAASGTRLFIAGLENPSQVRASKLRYDGEVAAFSDAQTADGRQPLLIDVPDDGGAVTALAVFDNQLFVFKASKIYVLDATGPDNLGQGSFGTPVLVANDIGAIDWRCVCVAKPGVFVRSHKGVYLVGRDLQPVYVGAPVEAYFPASATVYSAIAPVNSNTVRFQLSTSRTMVYDYELQTWVEHTDPGTAGQVSFIDTTGTPQLYIASSTKVLQQSASVWTDDSSAYEWRWKTGVVPIDSLQLLKRVRSVSLHGTFKAAHTANLSAYYNNQASATNYAHTGASAYQQTVYLQTQKLESLQIEFYESSPSGTQQAAEVHELLLEVALEQRKWRLPAAQVG